MSKTAYRPEIDGLRSVAVVPVILFHAGYEYFGGGYVGVDVFFVISGYLITCILLRDIAADDFSIWRFYERRARRILPALLLVMLVTLPFAWAWMTAPLYADFSASLLAVLGFVSNILFWQQSSYFDVAAELKPMLHTWSLAIEEQYYLFFPPLLWLIMRFIGIRGSVAFLVALAAASLVLTETMVRERPVAVFYLLPFRAWELLAGALCAYAHVHGTRREVPILALLGLLLTLGPIFVYDANTPFPSLYALVPVLGTVLVILFASPAGLAGRVLANPLAIGIGLISYSAYLWHQPLFAMARIRFDLHPGDLIFLPLSVLALLLAWLSWRFVEQPFRKGMSLRPFIAITGSAAAMVAAFGALGLLEYQRGYSRLAAIVYTDALIDTEAERALTWSTVLENPELADDLASFPEDGSVKLLLVGDSHAKDLFNALYLTEGGASISVRRVTMGGGCTDRIGARFEPTTAQDCFDNLVRRAGPLLEQADAVLLTKRWVLEDTFPAYLPVFISGLEAMGKTVAIGGNTVEYAPDAPMLLRRLARQDALDTVDVAARLAQARTPRVERTNKALQSIAEAASVPYLDKTPLLCSEDGQSCPALTADGHAIYFDYGHLTLAGARNMGLGIRDQDWLAPVLTRLGQQPSQ
ncbi:acyltransferase family protein [Shimia ponticola]|uniref:acyltransferase family protein n=1 Tax=Shimia ponticola TaxID=2582893 RepID=UPI0011BF820C|nr:acyltransferase family protein [Shimia ponticola]